MKATDLMAGCYVMVRPRNIVIKVAAIDEGRVAYKANKKLVWVPELLLRPIPLSKVHLVKNGFEVADYCDDVFIYRDGYEVKVIFDSGIPVLGVEPYVMLSIDFAEKTLKMEVEYLHTLQKAMMLFEVDKEIEI